MKRDDKLARFGRLPEVDYTHLSRSGFGYSAKPAWRFISLVASRYPDGAIVTNTSYVLFYPLINLLGILPPPPVHRIWLTRVPNR